MRILGVDPGSRLTGYGCIDLVGRHLHHVAHGTLRLSNTSGKAVIPLEDRLLSIYQGLTECILKYRPQIMVVERVFFAKNAVSALKLGQARGAAILTGKIHSLEIVEYSPTQVKQIVVGHGHADKEQVAKMVQILVGKQEFETSDASDGLALALCHAYSLVRVPPATAASTAYSHALNSLTNQRSNQSHNPRSKKRFTLAESVGIQVSKTGKFRK